MEPQLQKCPICGTKANVKFDNVLIYRVKCERCLKYQITYEAIDDYDDNYQSGRNNALISYWVRKNQSDEPILIKSETIRYIVEHLVLPAIKEQADNLIWWIAKTVNSPEQVITEKMNNVCSIIGCESIQTVDYIAKHLVEKGLLNASIETECISVSLTFTGWLYNDELLKSIKDTKIAFMAMQYNEANLENLYKDILKPAVEETGFILRRLDEKPRAGIIDNLLRVEIRKAKFLIADLSTDNRGAYWEAGFAEGLGKEVIYICDEAKFKEIHFDTNHCQTVPFNWEDHEDFKKRLKATIRATFPSDAVMEDP